MHFHRVAVFTVKFLVLCLAGAILLEIGCWVIARYRWGEGYSSLVPVKEKYLEKSGRGPEEESRQTPAAVPRSLKHLRLHPYFGYVFQPSPAGPANNMGFYSGMDYPYAAAPDEFVIGIFGGSVAVQFHQFGNKIISDDLAARLAGGGYNKITVLNFALPGYRQPQSFNVFVTYLDTIDMAIFVEGFNEAAYSGDGHFPIEFPSMNLWRPLVEGVDSLVENALLGRLQASAEARVKATEFFLKAPVRYSELAHLLWRALMNLRERRESELRAELAAEAARDRHYHFPEGMSVEKQLERYFAWYRRLLMMTAAIGHSAAVPVYHILQPNQYLEGSKLFSEEENRSFRNNPVLAGVVSSGYPVLRSIYRELREDGIAVIDLSQVFRDVAETVYADNDCHFNRRGIEIMVDACLEELDRCGEALDMIPEARDRRGRFLKGSGK